MKRRLAVAAAAIAVLAVAGAAVAILIAGHGGGDETAGGDNGGASDSTHDTDTAVTVKLSSGEEATFQFRDETHRARLLEVAGSSARIEFSSSPTDVTLTAGQPQQVDLTNDSTPDATVELQNVSASEATIVVTPLQRRTWDESGFQTQGGFAPYEVKNYYEADMALLPEEGGNLLLLYAAQDQSIHWERYQADGSLITSPQLEIGWLESIVGETDAMDVAQFPGGPAVVLAKRNNLLLYLLDPEMNGIASSLTLGRYQDDPAIAASGDKAWIVANGQAETLGLNEEGGRSKIVLTEIGAGTPVSELRQRSISDPGEGRDRYPDIAYDAESETLAVVYEREARGSVGTELRLAVVDPSGLTVEREITVAPDVPTGDTVPRSAVTAADGKAIVFWTVSGGTDIHVASVDLASGAVSTVWEGQSRQNTPDVSSRFDVELVRLADGPALVYLDPMDFGGEAFRFRVWPLSGNGWSDEPVTLEGGPPVLTDILIDLNAFKQNPRKAICGSQTVLEGAVFNRGSGIGRKVQVNVSVDGVEIGSISIGDVKPGQSVPFAIGWTPDPDLTAEQVTVEYTAVTETEEYSKDNNTAAFTAQVRQKGVVFGRVVNSSSDVNQESNWYPGLEGVKITVGDHLVLTDAAGFFTIEDLPFGSYTIQAEKDGFNPLTTDFDVTRTRPIAHVGMLMDNHGVLRIKVVDQNGAALSGVDVYLLANRQHDKTDSNGTLAYDISAGTYHFSFVKRGYWSIADEPLEVVLGQDVTRTVTMQEAATGFLSGQVVDKYGTGVANASVQIKAPDGTTVGQFTADGDGFFAETELPAKPPKNYKIIASNGQLTVEELVNLAGGDRISAVVALVPDRGDLRIRTATEGYTSWMIQASWPGFMELPSAAMYVWYGNYAIDVGAMYWSGTKELAGVDVTVWGGTYETHATKSEIDFTGMDKDYGELFKTTAIEGFGGLIKELATEHASDLLDIAGSAKDLFTGEAGEDAVITGQGRELITWKEALDDFNVNPEFDSSDPLGSMWNVVEAVPTSFAIPIIIGGSSVQDTTVRVDQVDVVSLETGEVLWSTGLSEWFSHNGDGTVANENGKHYAFNKPDVDYDKVAIYVWLTVQKLSGGAPGGTCFDQREQQVVVFQPGSRKMQALIAPGDMYRNP